MSTVATKTNEREAIGNVLQHYIDGATSGSGDRMRPAFHADATIFGCIAKSSSLMARSHGREA